MILLILVLVCAFFVATQFADDGIDRSNLSDSEAESLQVALDSAQRRAYYSDRIDWPATRTAAFAKANASGDITVALREVLRRLGDSHSMYLTPSEVRRWNRDPANPGSTVETWDRDGITYLSIPTFTGTSEFSEESFSKRISEILTISRDSAKCGWIVDIRQNRGGNMRPMLQGVEPLVGAGLYFSWQKKPGIVDGWLKRPVREPAWQINNPSVPALDSGRRLAVLQGPMTTSAGELLLISLTSRPNTRTFGAPTAGKASGNVAVWLPNGGTLALTTVLAVDRSGKIWDGPIPPDEAVATTSNATTDDAEVEAAARWLQSATCPSAAR